MPKQISPHLPLEAQDQRLGAEQDCAGIQEPLPTSVTKQQLAWLGTWRAARQSLPEPSFKAALRVGDDAVGRGHAGWTTLENGRPYLC